MKKNKIEIKSGKVSRDVRVIIIVIIRFVFFSIVALRTDQINLPAWKKTILGRNEKLFRGENHRHRHRCRYCYYSEV